MGGIEREILMLISRVRCMTENQVSKAFISKNKRFKKPHKKVLRKMCNEYTLRKQPCKLNYSGYRDSSYIYYLNGSKSYKEDELSKAIVGSELLIRMENLGCNVIRFNRNVLIDNKRYDIFIEYTDKDNQIKQMISDIYIDELVKVNKYDNLKMKIENTTIPFFEVPKVLIVTNLDNKVTKHKDVYTVDLNLSKLNRII